MKTITITIEDERRGPQRHTVEVLEDFYISDSRMKDLEALVSNGFYNGMTDWEHYRKIGNTIKKRKSRKS